MEPFLPQNLPFNSILHGRTVHHVGINLVLHLFHGHARQVMSCLQEGRADRTVMAVPIQTKETLFNPAGLVDFQKPERGAPGGKIRVLDDGKKPPHSLERWQETNLLFEPLVVHDYPPFRHGLSGGKKRMPKKPPASLERRQENDMLVNPLELLELQQSHQKPERGAPGGKKTVPGDGKKKPPGSLERRHEEEAIVDPLDLQNLGHYLPPGRRIPGGKKKKTPPGSNE